MTSTSDVAPGSLAAWVDARLRDAIITGQLAPGRKLVGEQLAAAWGVSATPVREALQRLAGEGLVDIRPQRGARVAAMDAADAQELYELRLVLDPRALRAAMRAADDRYRAGVDEAYRRLGARHRSLGQFMEAHRAFHLSVMHGCPNRRLHALVVQLHDHTQRYHLTGAGPHRQGDPAGEHAALRDAVTAGDVRHAVAVLTAHLRASLDAVAAAAGDA